MNRKYIVLLIIFIIYFLIMFIVFGLPNIIKRSKDIKLALGEQTIFIYEDEEWKNITPVDIERYDWIEYRVYDNNKYVNKYQIKSSDKGFLLFDENRDPYNITSYSLLGISGNKRENVINKDKYKEEIKDQNIKEFLSTKGFKEEDLTTSIKYSYDLDGDHKKENIYVVSNMYSSNFINNKVFSYIFYEKDGIFSVIHEGRTSITSQYLLCFGDVRNIVDLDNDANYEIVTSCSYNSARKEKYSLFGLENNEYKELVKD